ncbi:POTRA domain-containing protein [Larkinella sp. GY13]|uniref:POTRA domain-containing protein n=1 Tax=Larkinella sp. GY13 TaxID=3453720 RepID=UPI003EE950F1
MATDVWSYLSRGSVSLAVFALGYRFFFSRLTYFQWNRVYLLGCAGLSLLIPLLPLPGQFGINTVTEAVFRLQLPSIRSSGGAFHPAEVPRSAFFSAALIERILLTVYLAGCLYKTICFYRNLHAIFRLRQSAEKVELGRYCTIYRQSALPTFSFLTCIFLNSDDHSLTEDERAQVLQHEQLHVTQWHTIDLLLFEIVGIVFWFNPVVIYFNHSIRQIHEYFVDSQVTRAIGNVRSYGYLLLKLTTQPSSNALVNSFSTKPVFLRIQMLTQSPSKPMQKLKFLLIVPILALTTVLCSFLQPAENRLTVQPQSEKPGKGTPIGRISWKGNTVYSTAELTKTLDLKPGDRYDKADFNNRLFNLVGTDVSSLYMDKGYLYFGVDVQENRVGNVVNLVLTVFEGSPTTIGKIIIKGNKDITDAQIRDWIAIQPGELFNRSKLIKSQQKLAKSGYFNPKKIDINPIPNPEMKTVDLAYVLDRKP